MILTASLIGGWHKLELWDHSHLTLLSILFMVCVLEVVLLKITTNSNSFSAPQHSDLDYDDSSEYEEDIYYEELNSNYDQWARRRMRYLQRQQQQQQHSQQQQQYLNDQNIDQMYSGGHDSAGVLRYF